ncbi:hypothetical protein, partial [Pseudophaeobacter sp.]|uniref:hypothetical protein n=1 Tax=Pseudophaeobacter sp. TaxID=1971739 RepID=UPI003297BD08
RPSCVSSLPVEGVLVLTPNTRNTKINKITLFCKTNVKIKQKQHLIQSQSQQTCPKIKAKSRQTFTKPEDQTRVTPNIKTYPQTYQQNSTKLIGITLTKTKQTVSGKTNLLRNTTKFDHRCQTGLTKIQKGSDQMVGPLS